MASTVGCSVSFGEVGDEQSNSCDTTADCGVGSVCATGSNGSMCIAEKADLAGILFEIRPAADAEYGASTSYLIDPEKQGVVLDGKLDGAVPFDPLLPALVSITSGEINCPEDTSSIPAKVTLSRVFVGLPEKTYTASPEPEGGNVFAFHIDVPPDMYDIYVEPEADVTCGGGPMPPVFIREQDIPSDSTFFRLDVPPARHLTGSIKVPENASLDGWSLDVIESKSGRRISTVQLLKQEKPATLAEVDLNYNLTKDIDPLLKDIDPILRLKPPALVIAPTVYWDLAAADLQGKNVVMLALSDLAIAPREVGGYVRDKDQIAVPATVTLQSTSLSGVPNAAFAVSVPTDKEGYFSAMLPPGRYRVIAQPLNDSTKAIFEANWQVDVDPSGSCFCGQVVTLPDKTILEGEVLTPTQGALLFGSVVASPSLPPLISQFDRELGRAQLLPREASTFVTDGAFSLGVDFGQFDFSVRSPEESGYPWLVRSRLTVLPDSEQAISSVGKITVHHPVVVAGTIRDPSDRVVTGASIRAWLPVRKDGQDTPGTVIQIAEALSDESGQYTLLLPPSLSQ